MATTANNDAINIIFSQISTNLAFLEKQGSISSDSARVISKILESSKTTSRPAVINPTASSTFSASAVTRTGSASTSATINTARASPPEATSTQSSFTGPRALPPPAQAPQTQHARALYDYREPGDLTFRAGDMIELLLPNSDNDDWWTGKLNGVTGIFPSNHAERIPTPATSKTRRAPPPPPQPPLAAQQNQVQNIQSNEKPPLQLENPAPPASDLPPGSQNGHLGRYQTLRPAQACQGYYGGPPPQ